MPRQKKYFSPVDQETAGPSSRCSRPWTTHSDGRGAQTISSGPIQNEYNPWANASTSGAQSRSGCTLQTAPRPTSASTHPGGRGLPASGGSGNPSFKGSRSGDGILSGFWLSAALKHANSANPIVPVRRCLDTIHRSLDGRTHGARKPSEIQNRGDTDIRPIGRPRFSRCALANVGASRSRVRTPTQRLWAVAAHRQIGLQRGIHGRPVDPRLPQIRRAPTIDGSLRSPPDGWLPSR